MFNSKQNRIQALEAKVGEQETALRTQLADFKEADSVYRLGVESNEAIANALQKGSDEDEAYNEFLARKINEAATQEGERRAAVYIAGHKVEIATAVDPIAEQLALDGLRHWQETEGEAYRRQLLADKSGKLREEAIQAARKRVRDEVKAEMLAEALPDERATAELQARYLRVQAETLKSRTLDIRQLKPEDSLKVVFTSLVDSKQGYNASRYVTRTLALRTVEPDKGLCRVEDDSWLRSDLAPVRSTALRGGMEVRLATDNPYTDKVDLEPRIVQDSWLRITAAQKDLPYNNDIVPWQVELGDLPLFDAPRYKRTD